MIEVSIIIVKYKAAEALQRCLRSIPKAKTIEVIVVDNDQNNIGFTKGVNDGAKKARGKYLFILNPDCVLRKETIKELVNVLEKNPQVGLAGPQLLDDEGSAYLSFTKEPTVYSAPIVFSWINKWFPNNRWSREYWYHGKSLDQAGEVESISGAAMLVRRQEFLSIGGMDEQFFMYWEDYDLCARYRRQGNKIWFCSQAKITHSREASTDRESYQIKKTFRRSRYRYFRKYFGLPLALIINAWLLVQEEWQFLLIILSAAYLRFLNMPGMMPFFGDQGRDFLAAREAIEKGTLPLLGIESSVPRFAQGPSYVWLLMGLKLLFGGDPAVAGITAALTGLVAVILSYLLFYRYFNQKLALVSAMILATAPLVVTQARLAFMTNPIPLMSLFYLYSLFQPYRNPKNLFWVVFSFCLLFQFELAVLPLFLLIIWYGWFYWKQIKKEWVRALAGGAIALVIGLGPQIIYDLTHGFRQLGLFIVWVGYRIAAFLGFDAEHAVSTVKLANFSRSISLYLNRFFIWGHWSFIWFYLGLIGVGLILAVGMYKRRKLRSQEIILWLWLLVLVFGFVIHSAPSEAYFPVIFVPLAGLISWSAIQLPRVIRKAVIGLLIAGAIFNAFNLISHDFMMTTMRNTIAGNTYPYGTPLAIQKELIMNLAKSIDKPIWFEFEGSDGKIPHTLDGYIYLASEAQMKISPQGKLYRIYFDKHGLPQIRSAE